MRSFKKDAKIGIIVLAAAFVVAQFIRIEKTNPPVHSEISADPAVMPLLKKACYDCHSNETVWPWYANVAPASWLLESDVADGRSQLNFSEWGAYPGGDQKKKLEEIAEEVQEGKMPPWYYSIMHRPARLNPDERNKITGWTDAARGRVEPGQANNNK